MPARHEMDAQDRCRGEKKTKDKVFLLFSSSVSAAVSATGSMEWARATAEMEARAKAAAAVPLAASGTLLLRMSAYPRASPASCRPD